MTIAKTHHTTPQNSLLPWLVWGLGALFYFYESLIQVSLGVMGSEIMRDFVVTSQTLGILSGVYFYFYSCMQLPSGIMVDYFGPKRLLIIATTTCALSTIAFSMTTSFYMACAARLMIGFGSAFAVVCSMKLAANWFSSDRFAFLTGLMVAIGMVGAIAGEAPLSMMVDQFGWRESMVFMGIFGLGLTALIYFSVSDSPSHQTHAEEETTPHEEHVLSNLLALVKNKQLWLIACYGGLMYMSTPVFCGLWGVPFLMSKMHLSKTLAATYISLTFLGWMIASPLWGIYSNRIGLRKPPLYFASIGCLVSSLVFIYVPMTNHLGLQLALFSFGIFSAAFLPAFSVAKELCSSRYVATGLSFMNMMNMIGIAIVNPLIGFLLEQAWNGDIANDVHVYALRDYQTALTILPLAILSALIILPFIRETYCTSVHEITPPSTHHK